MCWISIPGPQKTKPATSGVWGTCRGCCNLAPGSLSMAMLRNEKAKPERSSHSNVCFKPGCGLVPVLTAVPALGNGMHNPLSFSMGSEWATISQWLLRLLNILELLEHIELYQFSQAGNYCFNKKYCSYILSLLTATDSSMACFHFCRGTRHTHHHWQVEKSVYLFPLISAMAILSKWKVLSTLFLGESMNSHCIIASYRNCFFHGQAWR